MSELDSHRRMNLSDENQPEKKVFGACPCGSVPTDLMISVPNGSKYGAVAGNCCGDWSLEFKAGYPKDQDDLIAKASDAWNGATA